jgi:tRNA-dihydrouridine synthase B
MIPGLRNKMKNEERKDKTWPDNLSDALKSGLRPVIPAPLAGYTDSIYRRILREHGARYLTYPLLSAHAVLANRVETNRILTEIEAEDDLIVQLFGGDPASISKAAKVIEDHGAVAIDFNLGCSVKKIAKSGGGAVLLNDIPRAKECLTSLRDAVKLPLSVKTRIGYEKDSKSSLEILTIIEGLGFSHATIHGRTFKQGFGGTADLEFIREFKEAASIPIIGNGDVTDHKTCEKMFEKTGVDGVMIGRALIGNPFMVADCQRYISTGEIPPPRLGRELLEAALYHYRAVIDAEGPDRGNKEMRKILAKYIHGIRGATALRIKVNKAENPAEVIRLIEEAASLQPTVGNK